MKSSRRAGPRSPPLSEFWLSATGWAKLVVRTRPPESTRTRSRGRLPGFTPGLAGAPVLSDAFASVSVLATTVGSGSAVAPGVGVRGAAPCSPAFRRVDGKRGGRGLGAPHLARRGAVARLRRRLPGATHGRLGGPLALDARLSILG